MDQFLKLSYEDLLKRVPSVFNQRSFDRTSNIYSHINTIDIIDDMRELNWLPVSASEVKPRKEEKDGYQKHMIQFQNKNVEFDGWEEKVHPRIVMTNSHDGENSFQFHFGIFRIICSNGLIVSKKSFGKMRIIHLGEKTKQTRTLINQYIKMIPNIMGRLETYRTIELNKTDKFLFAREVLHLKYPDIDSASIKPADLLIPKRVEDEGNSLWNVYNVIQENFFCNDITGKTQKRKIVRFKGVKSFDSQIYFNQKIWDVADSFINK